MGSACLWQFFSLKKKKKSPWKALQPEATAFQQPSLSFTSHVLAYLLGKKIVFVVFIIG